MTSFNLFTFFHSFLIQSKKNEEHTQSGHTFGLFAVIVRRDWHFFNVKIEKH